MKKQNVKEIVKKNYGALAVNKCCGVSAKPSCCGEQSADVISQAMGYTQAELNTLPEGANLGLGCGNPVALASLKPGDTVLDLGAGAGIDVFLASLKVGDKGKVIGVDMTPEMVARAQENAQKQGYKNVEFRLGEIENLPVNDNSVDVIISNCVINLSPDKPRVFKEAYRALKPGGRLIVSDMLLREKLPASILQSATAYVSCIAGASLVDEYLQVIKNAGFRDVKVVDEMEMSLTWLVSSETAMQLIDESQATAEDLSRMVRSVISSRVQAIKPA